MRIDLTQGKTALIDDEDWHIINRLIWHANFQHSTWYAVTRDGIRMHRILLYVTDSTIQVDHINGDGLDNRKANLRLCTNSQNCMNRKSGTGVSRFKGVSFHKATGKWQAQIKLNQKNKYIGLFASEITAAIAYDKQAIILFGEFASPNFPFNACKTT